MKKRTRKSHKKHCKCFSCQIKRKEIIGIKNPAYKKGKIIKKCLLCNELFLSYPTEKRKFCCLSHAYTYRLTKAYKKNIKYFKTIKNNPFVIWITAFWEAEGCIINKYKKRNYCINISQKDKTILNKIKKFLKIGAVNPHSQTAKCYGWQINNIGLMILFSKLVFPHIKIKRRKNQLNKFLKGRRVKEFLKYVN